MRGYEIDVQLTWKDQEDVLLTSRNTPRLWLNLPRLTRYLKDDIRYRKRLLLDLH